MDLDLVDSGHWGGSRVKAQHPLCRDAPAAGLKPQWVCSWVWHCEPALCKEWQNHAPGCSVELMRRIKKGEHKARLCRAGKRLSCHRSWQSCLRAEIPGCGGGRASTVVCAPRVSRVLVVAVELTVPQGVSTLVLASRDKGHLGSCGCAGTKDIPGMEKPFQMRQASEAMERKAGRGHRKD